MRPAIIVCVRCRRRVKGPEPGVGGVPVHTGHVDARRDQTCGWWGFELVNEEERES